MGLQLSVVGRTDIGRVRQRNEDSFVLDPALGIAVVADGMGGHPAGDVASRLAAEAVGEVLRNELARRRPRSEGGEEGAVHPALLARAFAAANLRLQAARRGDPGLDGMGTTLTCALLDSSSSMLVAGHIGDSRLYRFRDGVLLRLTRDDTWVQSQIDLGQLTRSQARQHPYRNVITRAIGLEEPPTPEIIVDPVQVGDTYLLCTDGLTGMLADQEIAHLLSRHLRAEDPDAAAAADALIRAANDAGGRDNITVVLLRALPG